MSDVLHMIQAPLDNRALLAFAHSRGLAKSGDDLGYALHSLLREAFDDLAPQPFALQSPRRGPPHVLGYALNDGAALRERMALYARPDVHAVLRPEAIVSKAMPASWQAGQRLGFELTACPIVRQREPGGRPRERDAFLAAVGKVERHEAVSREAVYRQWLERELGRDDAAQPVTMRLQAFRRQRLARRRQGEAAERVLRDSEKPVATFQGDLAVHDPAGFAALLRRGVGRHRAFGLGMLLLRPPRG